MGAEPTVFVVDNDQGMRESLQRLLEAAGLAVETFADAPSFLATYRPDRAGCLLLDIRMPHMNGLELQAELAARQAPIPIVIITAHGDIPKAVRALKAGALDFIEKPFNPRDLLVCIRAALVRDEENRMRQVRVEEIGVRLARLTAREHQVMRLITAGLLNKQIAGKLELSKKTVELYRARVMQKMEAESLAELVRMVVMVEPRLEQNPPTDAV